MLKQTSGNGEKKDTRNVDEPLAGRRGKQKN
ncbi:hypothetical protein COLO4_25047 [Corchorus olitorius]|uniref:Uncharacterized protein n=1 Tax=Corchorus olitorius TaxID=93759 RepID=A0A1R3I526_9ROSI|nr:hypothetical protein COLO4_25047 [Corchorus olitorius]